MSFDFEQVEQVAPAEFRAEVGRWLAATPAIAEQWGAVAHPSAADAAGHGSGLMRVLWDEGWGRCGWPTEMGGLGGSALLRAVLLDELWAAGVEVPHQYDALEVMGPLLVDVRPDLAAQHLADFIAGREWWVQALSEPEAGSDIASLRTRARRENDGPDGDYVLSGQKIWGSLGATSARAFVLARTGTTQSRHRGLTMFFVDLDSPGVTVRPIALASGVAHLSEIYFDDVRVPASRVLGEPDGGWPTLMQLLQYERGSYAWIRQAMLSNRVVQIAAMASERDDRAAQQLGRAQLAVVAVRAQTAQSVRRLGDGDVVGEETSVDKILLGSAEHLVYDVVRDLDPHRFLLDSSPAWDRWRDDWWYSRATTIFGGAAEVQRDIVADRVLHLPREAGSR